MKKFSFEIIIITYLITLQFACSNSPESRTRAREPDTIERSQSHPDTGERFTDLRMQDPEGKDIKLSQFVGNNRCVLVDCWASWCGPCLNEIPGLVKFYHSHHKKSFEIVSISFDQNHGQWVDAINSLGMNWPQMSDLKGWASTAAKVYHITSLPYTVLLDRQGKIIAVELRGNDLYTKIEAQLNAH